MSETPRTDALQDSGHAHYMSLQLARTIERELAAWKAYAERLEKAGDLLATRTIINGASHDHWRATRGTKP